METKQSLNTIIQIFFHLGEISFSSNSSGKNSEKNTLSNLSVGIPNNRIANSPVKIAKYPGIFEIDRVIPKRMQKIM